MFLYVRQFSNKAVLKMEPTSVMVPSNNEAHSARELVLCMNHIEQYFVSHAVRLVAESLLIPVRIDKIFSFEKEQPMRFQQRSI